ncbi:protein-export membrane protein SecD [Candidatus Uhrbacteria bacterium RIFCSPHIGHO2_12_FULL_46_13]|uniref:Protein translocase subunit SecD n=1 Tax=Candidatus Uhrbacteria bacterium RIFCSPLOWO2_01_FULL_47_25 TaxID=1802402 RepID=A0A1F7UWP7_9BACT|nr:MAG: Protein translocase subunit SecD [Parcubacteria group bacterium GW2011_GWA2_46_9]OGL76357.1 MAG: protein-export membrane protein SecD [Candidatus Uhrbacteria bacterium RIFCSPHIGHO2_12_FULL_46_13]OGL82699.1 MAG: protein-export membrane protein SecD [Candidatus Uhrbacteria bacterium RIFCSPLOWO2_01_FULL_47_25]OGL85905.1 MAG: protein-export membrane protein SecD [Candidatus Uhrbacteria bacterium RIFCSPLOWO2_02_FULL_46_19]
MLFVWKIILFVLQWIGWLVLTVWSIFLWLWQKLRGTFQTTRGRVRWALVSVIILALLSGLSVYPNYYNQLASAANGQISRLSDWPAPSYLNWLKPVSRLRLPEYPEKPFRLGLDLVGGTQLLYDADTSKIPLSDRVSALEGVRDVIERRVNAFGVAEPLVQTDKTGDQWRVLVELAGVKDVNEAIKQIGETPLLEFKEQNEAPTVSVLTDEQKKEIVESEKKAKKTAEDLLKRLNRGEDFAELAKTYSEDPGSKDAGGDLGWAKKGMFVPEFDRALFEELKVGERAKQPVRTQFGYHIIEKLEERQDDKGELEIQARHILIAAKSERDFQPPQNPEDQWKNTALSGKQLKRASVVFDEQTQQPQVSLEFNDEGSKLFEEITSRNVDKMVGIFLDKQPISLPKVQQAITGGRAVITGTFTVQEAKLLAQRLNAGALPVPINLVSQQTVGASLGEIAIQRSLRAGLYGFLLVAIFMILYYRLPGIIAVVALLMYAAFVLAIFKLWPVTLTLAGIAGFILSLGMAVDANILIFERLKEELRLGKSLPQAMQAGFERAWTSIRDSNVSSLITCVILSWFGTSVVKGFALTLAIGIVVSMFSAITVTRTFLRVIIRERQQSRLWLYGVRRKSILV